MSYPHYSTECGEHHGLVRDFGDEYQHFGTARPQIVCLCGSTREIVLSVGFYPHAKAEHGHGEGVGHDSAEKVALDELHKRKIDLADYVLVLNVGGYVGASTRSEIEYAEAIGRPVTYLEPVPVAAADGHGA